MIPFEAMPVVEVIRREVLKPTTLPIWKNYLRWGGYCPMGLCPKAGQAAPEKLSDFPYTLPPFAFTAFIEWWDEQTDAQKAVDEVWGQ